MVNIKISKDWNGYLAEVEGQDNLYAYWTSELNAKQELLGVIEMMMDHHLELVENERKIKNQLLNSDNINHAL